MTPGRLMLITLLAAGALAGGPGPLAAETTPAEAALPLATADSGGLSLEQAMDQAEAHSFTARIADKTAAEAENRAGETRGQLGPKVAVEAEDAWISRKVNKAAGEQILTTKIPGRLENASVVATQPLTGFAYVLVKLKADNLAAEAARHDESQSQADARLAGADAYIRAQKAVRLHEIAQASLAVIAKQRDDAAALERSGKLSRVDVLRLEFSLSDMQTQLIQARSAMDVAALSLIESLGLPADTKVVTLKAAPKSAFEERQLHVPDQAMVLGTATDTRPDLRSAESRVEAAEAYKTAAMLEYLPQISAFTRYERDFTATSLDVPPIPGLLPGGVNYPASQIQDNLIVGVTLNWTIWDWGSRSRHQGELAATADKAREAQAQTASRVHLEVAQAHAELRYSQQALTSSKASLRFAEEVYRATELKFKNGLATTTDLISAERDQTRARATVANAQGDLDLAWLRLKKASGEKVAL